MDMRARPGKGATGTVKVRNLSAVPEVLAELGADVSGVLAQAGLEPSLFSNHEQLISYASLGRLLNACVSATSCEEFGLRAGMRQSAAVLGLSGYVAANAPTVREALETIVNSLRLSDTGGRVSLNASKGFASLTWVIAAPGVDAVDQIDDAAIAISCNILRSVCGTQWAPAEVCLTRAPPEKRQSVFKVFQCATAVRSGGVLPDLRRKGPRPTRRGT